MTVAFKVSWGNTGRPHFLLTDPDGVAVNVYQDVTIAADWWDKGNGTRITASGSGPTDRTFQVPPDVPLRLMFSLAPTVDGTPEQTGLDVVQLLMVSAKGTVTFLQYVIVRRKVVLQQHGDDFLPGRKPEVNDLDTVDAYAGVHPLIDSARSAAGPVIRTDFIDITSLWWNIHYKDTLKSEAKVVPKDPKTGKPYPDMRHFFPFNPFYLDPACEGDPAGVRVLASTWGVPLIWFAVIPPTARAPLRAGTRIGGTVFFRPVASGYTYSSTDKSGLTHRGHASTGMVNVARYLLTGRTRERESTLDHYLPEDKALLLDHMFRPDKDRDSDDKKKAAPFLGTTPTMPSSRLRAIPAGMEEQLARVARRARDAQQPEQRVLLMPFPAADGIDSAYTHTMLPQLAGHVSQALALLWSYGGIGGPGQPLTAGVPAMFGGPASPLTLDPLMWIAGYSRGGQAADTALINNAADVSRFISLDDRTVVTSQSKLAEAARTVAKAGRQLRVFMVRSPSQGGRPAALIKALQNAKAEVNFLPKGDYNAFWAKPPFKDSTTWQHYLLADWDTRPTAVAADVAAEAEKARKEKDYISAYDGLQHVAAVVAGEAFEKKPQDAKSIGFVEQCFGP